MSDPRMLPRGWFERALAEAAERFDLAPAVVLSRSRVPEHSAARLALYAGLRQAEISSTTIGDRIDRDHSTIITGAELASERGATDPVYAAAIAAIAAAACGETLPGTSNGADAQMRERVAVLELQVDKLLGLIQLLHDRLPLSEVTS